MAELVVKVIGDEILKAILSFASEEISLVWGFKEDTERLANKMKMLQALLNDAENKNLLKSAAVEWVERLKDIALDADNVLDELAYEVLRQKVEIKDSKRKKVHNFFSSSNPLAFHHKMASKIKSINLVLDELDQEASTIGLTTAGFVNSSVEFNAILQTGPFVDDSEIVGRNNDISSIVTRLVNSEGEELPVIGIVGMPGQGKTTLAQLVYKNEEVMRYFGHRLWVCVFDNFSVDRVLNEMVEALTQSHSDLTNREAMVKKLQGTLTDKRFLLVLDDVWNQSRVKWNSMKRSLLEIGGSNGSKIMVTTRSEDVCLTMQTCMTHHLNTLSDEESLSLFKQVVFADGGAIAAPELVSIGKRILRRCGGVPLAVKAIAGVLYAKKDERDWLNIERHESWGSSVNEDIVLSSLRLSYNHLPFLSLKQCFGYCSLSQKNSIMEKDKLIQLWMAQGFINGCKENRMEMEDIGANYLNILLRNFLLLIDKTDDYGEVRTCKMHDIVHYLALDVSKNYCLTTNGEEVNEKIKAVNLSIVSGERALMAMSSEISQRLRTLSCDGVLDGDLLLEFKKLRVMILSNGDILELPNSIGKLKHLRLLDVSETKILRLPESLTKLYNLQTLRLHGLEHLPKDFGNLINLRHFYIKNFELLGDDYVKCLLPRIGQLNCLRTLPYFVVSKDDGCQINELQGLNNLQGALRIYCLEKIQNIVEAMEAKVDGKPNIVSLEYHWSSRGNEVCHDDVNDEDVLESMRPHSNIRGMRIKGYNGSSFPSWIMGTSCSYLLRNLVKIVLEICELCTQIPPLGCLPCLKIADINWMGNVSSIGNEFYGLSYFDGSNNNSSEIIVFPSLRQLGLGNMCRLVKWLEIDESQCSSIRVKEFPQLEVLKISACDELTFLRNMRNLTSLRDLCISFCSVLVCLPMDLGTLESLEELSIFWCSNLVSFPGIHGLHSLRKLRIENCPKVTYLPEGIHNLKLLQDLRIVGLAELVAIPDLQSLQSLRLLVIEDCEKLSVLPTGLESCTSLNHVIICRCSTVLLKGLHCLPSLRKLRVGPFSNDFHFFPWYCTIRKSLLNFDGNEDSKGHFVSLQNVTLHGWPNLTSLPQQLQFYSLTYLSIFKFKGLLALPEWLGNIKSLHTIKIWHCDILMYFPSVETMQSLSSLQKVLVEYCPVLIERCDPGFGPEWHKISHIPEISINAITKLKLKKR